MIMLGTLTFEEAERRAYANGNPAWLHSYALGPKKLNVSAQSFCKSNSNLVMTKATRTH